MLDAILQSLAALANPTTILVILLASLYGLFIGSIPGLTVTMAVALFVPFAFFLDPIPAMAAIVTLQAMGIFAGDIPGALIRMPGTPASAAYTDDSYALSQQGQARLVLGVDVIASALGGLIGAVALIIGASALAEFALTFSSYEFFWLAVLGLSSTAFIAVASPIKGLVSVVLGLFISTIGIDITLGFQRFTFGNPNLMGGISFIPAMIGLFGMSEVIRTVLRGEMHLAYAKVETGTAFWESIREVWRYRINALRGGIIGLVSGVLPGAGADIGAWLAYGSAKRFSKEPEKFGKGSMEAIVEAGVANNSDLAAEWIPTLVFGIPGDAFTAVVIGILMLKGMRPGPAILHDYTNVLIAIYVTFIIANLLMIPFGFLAIRASSYLLRVPRNVLMPAILMMCIVGAYAINNDLFDVGLMLLMGVLGFVLEANGFPVAPIILGLVLGPLLEQNFMISLIKSEGNLALFFSRPVSMILGTLTLIVWVSPLLPKLRQRLTTLNTNH
ncbi:MAG: tripartite tricarboxylate transporter permease [Anaerolineae bacterium]|nr:tripartite tricarboxylate transporter permease [Anaerolineae bacterium]